MTSRVDQFGETLTTLRKRVRMSQRELSKHSAISYTTVGDLERGNGGNPSPITLRSLARGLAADDFADNGYDPSRADAFYRQLMSAAGYLGGLPVELPPRKVTEEDVTEWLTKQTNDAGVAELLVRLGQAYPDLDPEDQMTIRRLAQAWIKISV